MINETWPDDDSTANWEVAARAGLDLSIAIDALTAAITHAETAASALRTIRDE